MNRNSNAYTFIFAIVLVVIVATLLAFVSESTKEKRANNVKLEKMQNIISTIGVDVSREESGKVFKDYIKQELSLKEDGSVDVDVKAFDIDLKNETKKSSNEQRYPIYIAEKEGKKYYVIPLFGAGLWDAVWGYISLADDKNTIVGASFDHKGETPGLGAEINQSWFEDQFIGKKIMEGSKFVSVKVIKGGTPPDNFHGVDGISGGTITSDGVSDMIEERLKNYLPYLKNN
ncbi:MAG: NADH:ubiquinone reductase (Na(+)-transporting) subunit C [Flavobacteriaceae bacterium]|nr:NADH:ubiquinone reductase (Na(+)-transporting) subunit C [Flavobacteriaceae bacterium]